MHVLFCVVHVTLHWFYCSNRVGGVPCASRQDWSWISFRVWESRGCSVSCGLMCPVRLPEAAGGPWTRCYALACPSGAGARHSLRVIARPGECEWSDSAPLVRCHSHGLSVLDSVSVRHSSLHSRYDNKHFISLMLLSISVRCYVATVFCVLLYLIVYLIVYSIISILFFSILSHLFIFYSFYFFRLFYSAVLGFTLLSSAQFLLQVHFITKHCKVCLF